MNKEDDDIDPGSMDKIANSTHIYLLFGLQDYYSEGMDAQTLSRLLEKLEKKKLKRKQRDQSSDDDDDDEQRTALYHFFSGKLPPQKTKEPLKKRDNTKYVN